MKAECVDVGNRVGVGVGEGGRGGDADMRI